MALFVYHRNPITVLTVTELTPLEFREQQMVLASFSSYIGFHVSVVKVPSLYMISSPYFPAATPLPPPSPLGPLHRPDWCHLLRSSASWFLCLSATQLILYVFRNLLEPERYGVKKTYTYIRGRVCMAEVGFEVGWGENIHSPSSNSFPFFFP